MSDDFGRQAPRRRGRPRFRNLVLAQVLLAPVIERSH